MVLGFHPEKRGFDFSKYHVVPAVSSITERPLLYEEDHVHKNKLEARSITKVQYPEEAIVSQANLLEIAEAYPQFDYLKPICRGEYDEMCADLCFELMTNQDFIAAVHLNATPDQVGSVGEHGQQDAMVLAVLGSAAEAYDTHGLTLKLRKLYLAWAERLIRNLFGDTLGKIGPGARKLGGSSKSGLPRRLRTYGISSGHTQSFPTGLLLAVLGNAAVTRWVDHETGESVHVWRATSQDDVEECMRVTTGPGGHKHDMRGTYHSIARRTRFHLDMLKRNNIVSQPAQKRTAYRRNVDKGTEEWNDASKLRPPFGLYMGSNIKKRKNATRSSKGKAAFRSAKFRKVFVV